VEGYRGLADTPSRLEGAEHEIDKWYGLTTKPAYLPFIESLCTGSSPVPTANTLLRKEDWTDAKNEENALLR